MLHYVALSSAPPSLDDLLAALTVEADLLMLAQELVPQWLGLLPGFHRLSLQEGRVLLTLCVGDTTPMLREQQFFADSVFVQSAETGDAASEPWNIWAVKALARCCRRGTRLAIAANAPLRQSDLTQCGFEFEAQSTTEPENRHRKVRFNPRWTIKNTRDSAQHQAIQTGSCAVIGAGLAGASVAAALARRGWQVQVLDQGVSPAQGASGLPVGLVVPHVSADDCTLSRLSRAGVRLMLQQARSMLVQGQDWALSGTLERQLEGASDLPDIWHAQAAWLKPAQLVQGWLNQPGIVFQGATKVADIRQDGDQWTLLDPMGEPLACVDRVILANADGVLPLLKKLQTSLPQLGICIERMPSMHGVRGQLSWSMHDGAQDALFPSQPINGSGSLIPWVPVAGGKAWFVGSSYQPDNLAAATDEKNHRANLQRLRRLSPVLGKALANWFADGRIQAWKNTRCVTGDRLPVVGPAYEASAPGLWICAGMGSRGLSFSVLCAELLAARWGAEPLPVPTNLAQSLTPLRRHGKVAQDQAG